MRRLAFAIACLLAATPVPAADADATTLTARLDALMARPSLAAATWGMEVRDLDSGATLYSRDAGRNLTPASTLKLLTTATALDLFGPDERVTTSVDTAARLDPYGRLLGDLFLVGRGDSSLSAAFQEEASLRPLESLADALVEAGLRSVEGRLVGHEGLFAGERRGADWGWADLVWRYGTEVSALSFADNCVLLRALAGDRPGDPLRLEAYPPSAYYEVDVNAVSSRRGVEDDLTLVKPPGGNRIVLSGSWPPGPAWEGCVALEDPALWTATVFSELLAARGIAISQGVVTSSEPLPADSRVLAGYEGATLAERITLINTESRNLHTELLLRRLGAVHGVAGTAEAGHDVIGAFLKRQGIDPSQFTLRDASGLSRANLVTARGLVDLLVAMWSHPERGVFRDSLAVAGRTGTLEHRMRGTAGMGRVRGKTGTLRHVYGLAGYVDARSGARLAFAVIVNHHSGPAWQSIDAVSDVAAELAR